VPVLAFYFGLPDPALLSKVQAAGVVTMGTATNKQEALQLVAAGIDCVVLQGAAAGGHRGTWWVLAQQGLYGVVRYGAACCRTAQCSVVRCSVLWCATDQ
jgi:nitronate monooxygenase